MGFAGVVWVVEGIAVAVAFAGAEEEALLGMFGQADETGLAIGIGADLEIELVEAAETVGDVDANVGVVDGLAGVVVDGEVGGAGAQAGVDGGDIFGGVGGVGGRTRRKRGNNQTRKDE